MLEQNNHTLNVSQFLEKYRYINFLRITITRFVTLFS